MKGKSIALAGIVVIGALVSIGSADTVINAYVQQFGATEHTAIDPPENARNVQIDWSFAPVTPGSNQTDYNIIDDRGLTFDRQLPNGTRVICKLSGHDGNATDGVHMLNETRIIGYGDVVLESNEQQVDVPVLCDPNPDNPTGSWTVPCDIQWIEDVKVITLGSETRDVVGCDDQADTDGDSLLDGWEVCGIDVNNDGTIDLNLPALGANRLHKDVFVEVDYMEFHQPRAVAISDVVTAFNNAPVSNPDGVPGVRLHVQVDEQVPHDNDLNPVFAEFDAIKATNFGTSAQRSDANAANILDAKRLAYHYSLFAHQYNGGSSSGIAEFPGNDFIVSLGAPGWGLNDAGTHAVGSREQQAETFMHEFGHNVNLGH